MHIYDRGADVLHNILNNKTKAILYPHFSLTLTLAQKRNDCYKCIEVLGSFNLNSYAYCSAQDAMSGNCFYVNGSRCAHGF